MHPVAGRFEVELKAPGTDPTADSKMVASAGREFRAESTLALAQEPTDSDPAPLPA